MRRPLLLSGFMGTGKSSLGPRVAARTRRAYIDLDTRVEARAGLSVPRIFATQGEAAFRKLEREELLRLLGEDSSEPPVIALGGGTLLHRDLRLAALDSAVVVTLEASVEEILRRVGDARSRPLLSGQDPRGTAEALLEQRQRAYSEAHARIQTTGRNLDSLAEEVLGVWKQDGIAVAAGENSYAVEIGEHTLESRLVPMVGRPSSLLVVSDQNVWSLHGKRALFALESGFRPLVVELPPGEDHKQIESVENIWHAALSGGLDRSSRLVAFGGGVVSDIAGFAAASYMRGIGWIGVPTTLLAMVDASVGGKTGIDVLSAKNAVGAFHQPRGVLCDVSLLATESRRGFSSALAEVVKTALIGDHQLLELLEKDFGHVEARSPESLIELVRRSIRVKARIVSKDERESGLRAVLNLGHTVGHALELQGGFSRLSHGEAVSLGMIAALRIGVLLGLTPSDLPPRIQDLLTRMGLPTDLSNEPLDKAAKLIGHDKKRSGKALRFVVVRGPEAVETVELELEELGRLVNALV